MKWLYVIALAVAAVAAFVLGALFAADPEGRGSQSVLLCWGGAFAALVTAVSLAIWG